MSGASSAAGGIAGPLLFIVSWVVAGALRDRYSPIDDAISRLAERGAADRWIVTAGMIAFGLGALLFATALRAGPLRGVSWIVIVVGATALATAVFPCSRGCPGSGAFTDRAHSLAAGIHYISLTTAIVASGLTFAVHRRFSVFSLAIGVVTVVTLTAQVIGEDATGLYQRVGLTAGDVWMATVAVLLIKGWPPFRSSRDVVG